jgi:hypothetical protein
MATTREQIDSRGRNLLQLLVENEDALSNVMNPSAKDQDVYHGPNPDDPVDILYPRTPSRVGNDIGQYTSYFLREFNLDGKDMNLFGSGAAQTQGDGVLTQAENDRAQGQNTALQGTATDRFEGKLHDEPFRHNQRYVSGGNERNNFMKLKGRKSLLTLYWEMRGAFVNNKNRGQFAAQGQDGQNKTYTNRYSGTDADTYVEQFHNQTAEFYFPPADQTSLIIAALNGFNLGQTIEQNYTVVDSLIDKGKQLTRDWVETLGNSPNDQLLKSFFNTALGFLVPTERVSQLYRPGWSRPAQPVLEKIPFSELMQQNLLLPPENGILPIEANNNDTGVEMTGTYEELYTQNRAVNPVQPTQMHDPDRYKRGALAGTGINTLQEPLETMDGAVPADAFGKVRVPFTFKDDDAVYLTHSRKHAGFTTNGTNVREQPDALPNAVTDVHRTTGRENLHGEDAGTYRANAVDVISAGDDQYFPFTFSTVNKKDSRIQICTLQASIQSLGEAYTPTWQSKHFFGRSEQVHTYTFTDRTIDISFVIHANEMRLLQNVYERVLWLSQQCYPDYSSQGRISSGPIIAMRVGDLFQYKAGFIRSLSYDWNFLGPGGKWELTKGMRMPQACSVQMSYQVIHEKVPDRDYNFYGGPAGGLGEGFKSQRKIKYNPIGSSGSPGDWGEDTDNSGLDTSQRFIPHPPLLGGIGEKNYLDEVDEKNQPVFANSAGQYRVRSE